ncbi:MAG: class I SAM-dependent methyltransferase, partial [Acidobacteria bacterium]|nr:class I SAM-dependent methyltransferase [Acidobacteriota bacterium]
MISNPAKSETQNFYDRIAEAHNVALRVNGYRKSVANYLRSLDLNIDSESQVLDAGSGTGIVTLGFYSAGFRPKKTYTIDLSFNSLKVSREQFQKDKFVDSDNVHTIQGNVLSLPFTDDSFDLILTCGVLEYVPLKDGMRELARVLKPGGKLVLIPIKPNFVGKVLKILYKFKIHSLDNVKNVAQSYFNIVGDYEFPPTEPMSWS